MEQLTKKQKTQGGVSILQRLKEREEREEEWEHKNKSQTLTSLPVVENNIIPLKHKKALRIDTNKNDKTSISNNVATTMTVSNTETIDSKSEKKDIPTLSISAYDLLEPKTSVQDVNVVEFTLKLNNDETIKKQINVKFDIVFGLIIDCQAILLMFGIIGKTFTNILELIKAKNNCASLQQLDYGYDTVISFFGILKTHVEKRWVPQDHRISLILKNEMQFQSAFAKLSELYNLDLVKKKSEARDRVLDFFSEVQQKMKQQHMIDDIKLCDDSTSSFANLSYHIDKVLSKK